MRLHRGCNRVSFNDGPLHGAWKQEENSGDIYVSWHHKAEEINVKMHVYKRLEADVNVWELVKRDGETIPNVFHPYRCLLMYTNGQPRMNRAPELVPMELPMRFDSSDSKD